MKVSEPNGFTLIEMMIVIAIISMLSIATVPSYLGSNPDRRLRAASRELYAGFKEASSQALNRSENITITFNLAAESFSITDSTNTQITNHIFSPFIDIYSVTAGGGGISITYNSRGMAQSGKVKLQYQQDNNAAIKMGVRVTSAGGISIIDERDSDW